MPGADLRLGADGLAEHFDLRGIPARTSLSPPHAHTPDGSPVETCFQRCRRKHRPQTANTFPLTSVEATNIRNNNTHHARWRECQPAVPSSNIIITIIAHSDSVGMLPALVPKPGPP